MEERTLNYKFELISKRYTIREPYMLQAGFIGREYCFQLLYGDSVVSSTVYRSIPAENVLLGWLDHNLTVHLNTYQTLVAIRNAIIDLEDFNANIYIM